MKQNILSAVVFVGALAAGLFAAQPAAAQSVSGHAARRSAPREAGIVRGTVTDPTGAIIPDAKVALTNASGQTLRRTETSADGAYTFRGVIPGTYSVIATYSGLQQSPLAVSVTAGHSARANIVMTVQVQQQELTVNGGPSNQLNTEPANNATALVLKQSDLDALPDDPDDLQADLEALAGPGAGPGGTQFYIDGFTGGQMPPKSSIREIRINTNPFSAQFHSLGYGRIEIFTKPGTDRLHGSGYFDMSDDIWNARNPFLSVSPSFRTEIFGGNVSGPINKHASFFIDVQRRNIDDNGVVTATIPAPNFLGTQTASSFYPTPQRRTRLSPRIDYQIGANNT
ncbi:MAG: beta-sandwich domain-containing protein, partial [Bryobacteraceae bacterium]